MKKIASWVVVAAVFMAGTQIAVSYVKSNKKFEVVHSQAVVRDGDEDTGAEVRVYASPAIKWEQAPGIGKILGRIFWIMIAVAAWYIGTDRHLSKKEIMNNSEEGRSDGTGKAIGIMIAPLVLCVVSWFAGYSASLDMGSMVKPLEEFRNEFKISDETISKIISEGGSGVNIKDENGLLTAYFLK